MKTLPHSESPSSWSAPCPGICCSWRSAALTLALSLSVTGLAVAQTDNFNDGSDAEWFHYDPIGDALMAPQNTWSFPSGGYRLQAPPTPNPAAGPGRAGSFRQDMSYDNFHLSIDLMNWNPTLTNAFGFIARAQPAPALGTLSGYVFGYVTGDNYLALVRLDGERTRGIPGSAPFPIVLTAGHGYRLTFTGKGSELVGKLYDLSDLETPLATVPASDGTYLAGTAGLIAFGVNGGSYGPVDVTFDNYAATDRDRPRLQCIVDPFGDILVSWPQFEGAGFTLQSTTSLGTGAIWGDVTDNIFSQGENFVHGVSPPESRKFFRLIKSGGGN